MVRLGPDVAAALHEQAEQDALKQITTMVCQSDLLQQASDRAQAMATQLLQKSGDRTISGRITPAAARVQS